MMEKRSLFDVSTLMHLSFFILFSLGMVIYRAYSVAAVLLLILALYTVVRYRKNIAFKRENVLVLGLLSYALINIIINIIAGHSGRDYEFAVRILLIIPILYMTVYMGINRYLLMAAIAFGGIAMGIYATYDVYVLGAKRAGVFPVRFGYVAAWLAIASFVSVIVLDKYSKYRKKFTCLIVLGALSAIVASVLSGTRASWLFIVVALLVLGMYFVWTSSKKVQKRLLIFFGILVVAGGVTLSTNNYMSKRINQAILEVTMYTPNHKAAGTSLGMRLEIWRVAGKMLENRYLTGIGTQNFHKELKELVDQQYTPKFMMHLKHLHNDVIEDTVTVGVIVGMAFVLCLYILPFLLFAQRLFHKNQEVRYYAVQGAILVLAWVMFGLSDVFMTSNQGAIYYLVSLSIFWGGMRHLENTEGYST